MPLIILLTDGVANVSVTGMPPQEEAYHVADLLRQRGVRAVVIDMAHPFATAGLAEQLAIALGGPATPCPNSKSKPWCRRSAPCRREANVDDTRTLVRKVVMSSRTKLGVLVVIFLAVAFALAPQATAQAKPTPPAAELQQSESPSTGLPAVDAQAPAVRIVMFWANGCPHCHAVLDQVLPPLQAQYGDQLQVHLIEVSPEATLRRFFQVAAALGIDQNDVFVPFLMIGDQVLIGSQEIRPGCPD